MGHGSAAPAVFLTKGRCLMGILWRTAVVQTAKCSGMPVRLDQVKRGRRTMAAAFQKQAREPRPVAPSHACRR
jgi:hypothetical protein